MKDQRNSRKCRFCQTKIDAKASSPSAKPAFKDVCRSPDCLKLMENACDKILPCGHLCCGFSGEKECLPCLNSECVSKNGDLTFG